MKKNKSRRALEDQAILQDLRGGNEPVRTEWGLEIWSWRIGCKDGCLW